MAESLADKLSLSCRMFSSSRALSDGSEEFSYGDFDRRARLVAAGLRDCHIGDGSPVIVKVANRAIDLVAFQAVWMAGGVVVPLHRDTPLPVLEEAKSTVRAAVVIDGEAIEAIGDRSEEVQQLLPGAALIVLTSGSTGKPKGVILSHQALVGKLAAIQRRLEFGASTRSLLVLQITFSFGIWVSLLTLLQGGELSLHRKFTPSALSDALASEAITDVAMVPTMIRSLMTSGCLTTGCRSLSRLLTGGEPLATALVDAIFDALPKTKIVDVYGLTETCTSDFMSMMTKGGGVSGSIGMPTPDIEFRIAGETGDPVLDGHAGELQIKTPFIMSGYLNEPGLTASAFDGEYFKTGDLARVNPDGSVELVGRSKEIISRGGNKVAPLELDNLIMRHRDISAALTTGVPDERIGERIHVLVVIRSQSMLGESGLRDWINERVDRFKRPDVIHFAKEIPLGRSGKGDRRLLREMILAGKLN